MTCIATRALRDANLALLALPFVFLGTPKPIATNAGATKGTHFVHEITNVDFKAQIIPS